MSKYLKAVMAVLGAVLTGLASYYGETHWYPIVVSAVTALSVYLVPNAPAIGGIPTNTEPVNPTPAPAQKPGIPPHVSDGWDQIQ